MGEERNRMSFTRITESSPTPEDTQLNPILQAVDKYKPDESSTSTDIKSQHGVNIRLNPRSCSTKNLEPRPIAKILEEFMLDEPSTSTGIKAQYTVNLRLNLRDSNTKFRENDSLSDLDDQALRFFRENDTEDDDSFVTVNGCREEIGTSTDPAPIFGINEQMQNITMERSPPSYYQLPPPYDDLDTRSYQGRIGLQPIFHMYPVTSQITEDRIRAPPYRRHEDFHADFYNKRIRNNFVQKVYMILSSQQLLIFGFIFLCVQEKNTREFIQADIIILIVTSIVFTISYIVLVCSKKTRRIFPLNVVLLVLLTLSMGYLGAAITCIHNTHIIMVTVAVTGGLCTLISLLACQDKFDVTNCGMVLFILVLIVLIYGLLAYIISAFTSSKAIYVIYSCLITIIICMYLMYDTQQILGGRRIELSPKEYILGAIQLHVDIMLIFTDLLEMYDSP